MHNAVGVIHEILRTYHTDMCFVLAGPSSSRYSEAKDEPEDTLVGTQRVGNSCPFFIVCYENITQLQAQRPRERKNVPYILTTIFPWTSPAIIRPRPSLTSSNGMTASISGSILCLVTNSTRLLNSSIVPM